MGLTRIGTIVNGLFERDVPPPPLVRVPIYNLEIPVALQFQRQMPLSAEQLKDGWNKMARFAKEAPAESREQRLRFLTAADAIAEMALVVTDQTDDDGFIVMRKEISDNLTKAIPIFNDIEEAYEKQAARTPKARFVVVSNDGNNQFETPGYKHAAFKDFTLNVWRLNAVVHASYATGFTGRRGFTIG